jgi:hypothetical protein
LTNLQIGVQVCPSRTRSTDTALGACAVICYLVLFNARHLSSLDSVEINCMNNVHVIYRVDFLFVNANSPIHYNGMPRRWWPIMIIMPAHSRIRGLLKCFMHAMHERSRTYSLRPIYLAGAMCTFW